MTFFERCASAQICAKYFVRNPSLAAYDFRGVDETH